MLSLEGHGEKKNMCHLVKFEDRIAKKQWMGKIFFEGVKVNTRIALHQSKKMTHFLISQNDNKVLPNKTA